RSTAAPTCLGANLARPSSSQERRMRERAGNFQDDRRARAVTATTVMLAAAAAVAAMIVATCGYSALSRIGTNFPGFFVWENGFVPAVGTPSWSGAASGLEYYSWLERVEGRPFATIADIENEVARRPPGAAIRHTVRRG